MPTHYTRFIDNSEVIDVVFMLSLDRRTVKEICKELRQKQPTVSTKIRYLVENDIVNKKGWEFEVNDKKLASKFASAFREVLGELKFLSSSASFNKIKRNAGKIMTVEVSRAILSLYAKMFIRGYRKLSVKEMVRELVMSLSEAREKEIKKFDPRLLELKKAIKAIPSGRKLLFELFRKT